MIRLAAVLLVCATAMPAHAGRLDTTLLVAAETSLAIDAMQTLDIQRHGGGVRPGPDGRPWSYTPMYEMNPLLGSHPSDATVCAYFAGAMVLTGAAWYALPQRLRFLAPLAVLIVQVPQIDRNARAGLSIRF